MMLPYIDKFDSLNLHVNGLYERFETKLVREKLKPGDTFIDVGAHIGYYTVLAAEIIGRWGRVYAFEPAPENFMLLIRNIKASGFLNVYAYLNAISDFNDKAKLYLSEDNSGDHRLFETKNRKSIVIDVISLDEFFEYPHIKQIDFIKIDVQGVEDAVLRGAKNIIQRSPNIKILVECAPAHLKLAGSSSKELIWLLKDMRFDVFTNHKNELVPVTRELVKPNRKHGHINLYCERKKES